MKRSSSNLWRRPAIWLSPFIAFGLIFALILYIGETGDEADAPAASATVRQEDFNSIPPLWRSNAWIGPNWRSVVAEPARDREELLVRINQISEAAPGLYGVYIHELDTGQGFGINEDLRFNAASTNKIPIIIKLYKEIELGNVGRQQQLTYLASDFEEGSGSIQTASFGTSYAVARLAEAMMKESDNVAKNIFFRLLGYSAVESFARGYGSDFDVYYNLTSPQGMAVLLRLLYEGGIVNPDLSQEIIDLMTGTELEDRLPRYLNEVPVAHKTGSWEGAFSDAGIVLHPEHPFVICVYSSDSGSETAAAAAIALIAAQTYAYEISR